MADYFWLILLGVFVVGIVLWFSLGCKLLCKTTKEHHGGGGGGGGGGHGGGGHGGGGGGHWGGGGGRGGWGRGRGYYPRGGRVIGDGGGWWGGPYGWWWDWYNSPYFYYVMDNNYGCSKDKECVAKCFEQRKGCVDTEDICNDRSKDCINRCPC